MRVVLALVVGLAAGPAWAGNAITDDAVKAAQEPPQELRSYQADVKARLDAAKAFMPDRDAEIETAKQMRLGQWVQLKPGDPSSLVNMDTMPGKWVCSGNTIKSCVNLAAQH